MKADAIPSLIIQSRLRFNTAAIILASTEFDEVLSRLRLSEETSSS
jgi:hypothetical protein